MGNNLSNETPLPQIDLLNGNLYAANPEPTYRWLRDEAPIYWDDINNLWGISRYADVALVDRDSERYSSLGAFRPLSVRDPELNPSMINFDDPRHQDHRRLIHRRFTPRAVARRQERIDEVIDQLISEVERRIAASEEVDAVEHLAAPLPAMMIAEDLGFGAERWRDIKRWSEVTVPLGGGDRYMTEEGANCAFEVAIATSELIEARRAVVRSNRPVLGGSVADRAQPSSVPAAPGIPRPDRGGPCCSEPVAGSPAERRRAGRSFRQVTRRRVGLRPLRSSRGRPCKRCCEPGGRGCHRGAH